MQRMWWLTAFSTACWLCSLLAGAAQQEEYKVTLDLLQADLRAAIQLLTEQTGMQVVFEPNPEPYSKITLSLRDQPFEKALEYICRAAGARYRRESDGVYVIGPYREASTPNQTTPVQASPSVPPPPVQPATVVEKIYLMHTRPRDIVQLIKLEMQTSNPFEELQGFTQNLMPNPLKNSIPPATPLNLPNTMNPTSQIPAQGINSSSQPETGAGQFGYQRGGGGFGQPGGGFGQPGGGFGQPGGGFGQPGGGFGQPGGGQVAGGGVLLPPGEGELEIMAYDVDNSVIVRGTPEKVEYIRKIIRQFLDIPPKQVMIKAEFITVSSSELRSFGIDWDFARVNLQVGAPGFAPGTRGQGQTVFINYANGNLVTALRAQLTSGKGKIVNAPIITTMNNTPAFILDAITSWIAVQTIAPGPIGGQPVVSTTPVPVNAVTGLSVTPRINADGTITLVLTPTVQDFGKIVTLPNVGNLPEIINQSVFTVRRIKNGETIVIGGLIRKTEQTSTARIPILGDMPLIGQFFRNKNTNLDEQELLIFVTAEVLPDPVEQGSAVTP